MSTRAPLLNAAAKPLISLPADSHATKTPDSTIRTERESAPASDPTQKAASSGNSSEFSRNASRVGFSLRMFLESELKASTGFSFHWNERATPAGRPWWVLATLAHRMTDYESGSLDADSSLSYPQKSLHRQWPTPKADSKAEAIQKLISACEEGEFNPFLDRREEDWFDYEDIENYVMEGQEPTFEGEK
jgi:hypothetical protein